MPIQPVWAQVAALPEEASSIVKTKKRTRKHYSKRTLLEDLALQKRKTVRRIKRIPGAISAMVGKNVEYLKTPLPELAQVAYGDGPLDKLEENDFIGTIEKEELLLNEIMHYLGSNAQTSLGPKALEAMINTFDKEHMLEVQGNIRHLVHDDNTYEKVKKLLTRFSQQERALLTYWDPHINDPRHLLAQVKELDLHQFFAFNSEFSLGMPPLDKLPNPAHIITLLSRLVPRAIKPQSKALGAWARVGGKLFYWVYAILMAKNSQTFVRKLMMYGKIENPIKNASVEFWAALAVTFLFWKQTENLAKLKKDHEDYQNEADDKLKKVRGDALNTPYNDIIDNGSYADLFGKTIHGYHPPSTDIDEIHEWIGDKTNSVIPDCVKNVAGGAQMLVPECIRRLFSGIGMIMGDSGWLLPGLYYHLIRTKTALSAFSQSIFGFAKMYYVWGTLQDYMINLADCLRTIRSIKNVLLSNDELKKSVACSLLREALTVPSPELKEAMKLAHSPRFVKKKASNGYELRLNELMLKAAPELQPALHGIGYLDAIFSIAKLIRMNKGKPSQLCFVDWLPDGGTKAQLVIQNGTLLVMPKAQPNSMSLGFQEANKAILTGPNGAGKSVFIKMLGSNTILAHAFGIAAAEKMSMHWLSMLRTSIDPGESLADDLSQMQAQKVRMDSVIDELAHVTKNDSYAKGMFLTDEPLSGTTHNIAAMFMEDYCEFIGPISQMCGVMATHNEEPTKFGDKGFVNYKVCIEELANGTFKPLFKVEPGIPEWWFSSDPAVKKKQKHFVLYTVAIKHRTNIEKEIAFLTNEEKKFSHLIENHQIKRKQKKHLRGIGARIRLRLAFLDSELQSIKAKIERLEKGEEL